MFVPVRFYKEDLKLILLANAELFDECPENTGLLSLYSFPMFLCKWIKFFGRLADKIVNNSK